MALLVLGCACAVKPVARPFDAAAPDVIRAELVHFGARPFALDSHDYIEITFDVTPASLSLDDIQLLVEGDTFGDSDDSNSDDVVRLDWPNRGNPGVARVYLGSNFNLRIGGNASPQMTDPGSPSGLIVNNIGFVDLIDSRVRLLKLKFDRHYANYQAKVLERAKNGDSCLENYNLSYDLDGLLAMYEATRDEEYLQESIRLVDLMLDKTDDQDGDGYLDFTGTTHTLNDNKPSFNIALCDWKGGRAIARLARLLDEDPEVGMRYPERRARYRSFVDIHLVEKWSEMLNQSDGEMFLPQSVYLVESDNLIHRVAHYGDIVVDAWLANKNRSFKKLMNNLVRRVCADLQDSELHPDAVEWDIVMRSSKARRGIVRRYGKPYDEIGDTSHANGTVSFLVSAALRADRKCRGRDVVADLTYTFRNVIARYPDEDRKHGYRFADFVDGGVLDDGRPYSIGRFIEDGWLKLGEVDSEVQNIAQGFFDEGHPVHRLQFLGNLARNYAVADWQ